MGSLLSPSQECHPFTPSSLAHDLVVSAGHDVVVSDYTTVSPGVHISGCVHIGRRVFIGTGAVIINGTPKQPIVIEDDVTIGAGACVINSFSAGVLVGGVPASILTTRQQPNKSRIFLSPPHMSGLETEFVNHAFDSNYIAPLGPMAGAFENSIRPGVLAGGVPASILTTRQQPNRSRIFLSPPHMSGLETEFVNHAFESNYIAPLGPMVDAFEREFAEKVGMGHAVALSSGTAAMHLAMRNLEVEPGDEVFVSDLTFIGSVTPTLFEGARPVFIDCDRSTWNMDTELLATELSRCHRDGKLPKAVVPTDLYGQPCDVAAIAEICRPYGIPVIVDSAEGLGAAYNGHATGVGSMASVYSFNGNKIITTSGGGMLASDDREFIERARFLSQQARDPFSHYEHSEIGYNYRMSNILAAIGRGQLRVLDERVKRKREIFDYYRSALVRLPGIDFMPEAPCGTSNRWLTVVLIDPSEFGVDREFVRLSLEAENIESRPVWKPMHMQPVFMTGPTDSRNEDVSTGGNRKRYAARLVGGKVSEDLFTRGLCLPSGTQMTEADLARVVKALNRARVEGKKAKIMALKNRRANTGGRPERTDQWAAGETWTTASLGRPSLQDSDDGRKEDDK